MSGTKSEIWKFAIRSRDTWNQGKPCWFKIKNGLKFPFFFWRQNGAKSITKGNGAKNVFLLNFMIFHENHCHSNQNWRHLIGAISLFICESEKYGMSAFTGTKNYTNIFFRSFFNAK